MDAELDKAEHGPRWLKEAAVAACVVDAIRRGERTLGQYVVHAFVVMPNHVHLLMEPRVSLARITNGLKGVSARDANRVLGRTGEPFWQDESFDHWVRDAGEFERIRNYIIQNPVRAGLVGRPEEWPWSGMRLESR
jgi:putative transposase